MWLAELLAGVLHGFAEIMAASKTGTRVVVGTTIVIGAVVVYVVFA